MLKQNIIVGIAFQGLSLLLSLIATRFVFRELGAEVLGIFSFSFVLTAFFITLSDMGLSVFIAREVAAYRHRDGLYVEELVGGAIIISWVAFLISAVLVIVLASWLVDGWLHIEKINRSAAIHAIQVISVSLLLAVPRAVYGAVVAGYERIDALSIANFLVVALQQIGLIVVLSAGGGLLHIVGWFVISAIVGLVSFVYLACRFGGFGLLRPRLKLSALLHNLRLASHLFVNSFLEHVLTQIDKWMVSKFLPVGQLGYYGFVQAMVSRGTIVPSSIASASLPALVASAHELDVNASHARYRKLQDLTCYAYMPVSAAVAMLGIILIGKVFDAEIAELAWRPLVLLVIGQYLLGLITVPRWLAVARGRQDIALHSNLWAMGIVAPLAVLLVARYGLFGAAASSVLYGIWQLLYFVPRFCAQCLGSPVFPWYRHAGIFLVAGVMAYGVPWFGASMVGEGLTLEGLSSAYLLGTLIFLIAGWFHVEPDLRSTLLHSGKILLRAR